MKFGNNHFRESPNADNAEKRDNSLEQEINIYSADAEPSELEENIAAANDLLKKETNVNYSILSKIANNELLRKAFYTMALFVGLLETNKAFSQEKINTASNNRTEKVANIDKKKDKKTFDINNFLKDSEEYIKNNEYFSKHPNSLMSLLASAERPNDYQAEQIVELHDSIVNLVKEKKFDNDIDLLAYINSNLDSNFLSQKVSVNLKDAFPEQENKKPKGTFDCDSRAVMVSSILQTLGYTSKDITMFEREGHMLVYSVKEDAYFELTTNKEVELSKDERAQINEINSSKKYFSYLLSNKGTALALEGRGNIFSYPNKEKLIKSIEILKKAVELDNNNLTAKLNLIKLLSDQYQDQAKLREAAELYKEVLASLVYRYNGVEKDNIESEYKPSISMKNEQEMGEQIEEKKLSLEDLSVKAIQESEYIKKKFQEYAELSYYNFKNYQEAINMYEFLLKNTKNNKKNEVDINNYKLQILDSEFKNYDFNAFLKDYDKFTRELRKSDAEEYFDYNLKALSEQKLVARIVSGQEVITKENVKEFIKLHESDPIVTSLTSKEKRISTNYMEALKTLKDWEGYKKLKNLLDANI